LAEVEAVNLHKLKTSFKNREKMKMKN